ncbi:hypothetical protein [Devosia oryzisoli]|uniref:hypothetical protein n=1 Tax=Devosia oryzisoli TaxID=2774138 RepID=UPI0031F5B642
MNNGLLAYLVLQIDKEPFASAQGQAMPAVIAAETKSIARPAEHVDDATFGDEAPGSWLLGQGDPRQRYVAGKGEGGAEEGATRELDAHDNAPKSEKGFGLSWPEESQIWIGGRNSRGCHDHSKLACINGSARW